MDLESRCVQVTEEYHVALARRTARRMAEEIGFTSRDICYIETSVSELATNLLFHTLKGGILFFIPIQNKEEEGIEIISRDDGPGIPNLNLAMQDGFSTYGSMGGGLPGIRRLMDEFEINSKKDSETIIVVKKWKKVSK